MGNETKVLEPKFRSAYSGRVRKHTPAGSKIEIRHEYDVDKWGHKVLVKTRKVDVYSIIQSHKDETDIEKIIRRATEGDVNALNVVNATYMDITEAPKNLLEQQNIILKKKIEFEKLPKDIKKAFDYDVNNYIGELVENPESWAEKTGLKIKWQEEENQRKAEAEFAEMQKKAIENLAQGTVLKNNEGVKSDE